MPRYHFNVYDGIEMLDKVGVELPDSQYARREAIRYAGSILEGGASKDKVGPEWRMEVTNEVGLILFRLDFQVTESAALLKDKIL
ncbi:hypothetical protein [Methylobacterium sp. 77]|uniref:DUF6894 family protein n=1 Tax=Methylobacterium sp. 77 TaxID=1101192 RepID=UPI0003679AF8|nr:hypothetical protein [Methylobacterium sp. 77]